MQEIFDTFWYIAQTLLWDIILPVLTHVSLAPLLCMLHHH